jgi:prevent-host-death family protein
VKTVNIHEAKTHLSRLLQQVASGEEIIIAKSGKPMAMLVPCPVESAPREPGFWAGRVHIADDFDELPDDIAAAFRGEAP